MVEDVHKKREPEKPPEPKPKLTRKQIRKRRVERYEMSVIGVCGALAILIPFSIFIAVSGSAYHTGYAFYPNELPILAGLIIPMLVYAMVGLSWFRTRKALEGS